MSRDTAFTERIIGAAYTVLNALKPGLDEKLYERALVIELAKHGLRADTQKSFQVHYDGEHIGTLVPDLIIEDRVIVDTKVVSISTTAISRRCSAISTLRASRPRSCSTSSTRSLALNASRCDFSETHLCPSVSSVVQAVNHRWAQMGTDMGIPDGARGSRGSVSQKKEAARVGCLWEWIFGSASRAA